MFLITCPSHDVTTTYISAWSKDIIDTAISCGTKTIKLMDNKAIRTHVHTNLTKKPIKFIVFNGHGDSNTITGHNNEPLIKSPGNEDLLNSKIVYCRSCCSGEKLGPDSVKAGANAFIGYDDEFIFLYDPAKVNNPLNDKCAAQFLEPTNVIAINLLQGDTVKEANIKSKQQFMDKIQQLLGSNSNQDLASIRYLVWDMQHQIVHGDEKSNF